MIDTYDNVFYFGDINYIGGVESWMYYIAKTYYKTHNILVLYKQGDYKQVERLRKYVKVIKYNNEKIKCKKIFYSYWNDILDNVEAEEYINFIHGLYNKVKEMYNVDYKKHSKTTKIVSVSEEARKSLLECSNVDSEVCYNIVNIDKPKKILKLVSATRLTKEKGFENMIKLGEMLDKSNIPYQWLVFTDALNIKHNIKNMILLQPTLDVIDYVNDCDYVVQLSQYESSGYSPQEAWLLGKKTILTDIPAFREIGANEDNTYFFNDDFNIQKVYEDKDRVISYTPPKSTIDKYLFKSKPIYKYNPKELYRVQCKIEFNDLQENTTRKVHDIWNTTKERAEELQNANVVEIIEIGC